MTTNYNNPILIREIKLSEFSFLKEMLYKAIFIPEGTEKLPKDIVKRPELWRYISEFGRSGDICLVAEIYGKLAGAIWTRIFNVNEKGYGFVNTDTPELSMAVADQYQRKGIGTLLLKEIIRKLTEQNYQQVSLSVDKQNYAFDFYIKQGFEIFCTTEKSATLIKQLIV